MSSINQSYLKNKENNKLLKFYNSSRVSDNITINNIFFSLPENTVDSNFGGNFGGFNNLISVDFMLFNDGTDKSGDASSIITLKQQKEYLKNTIIQGKGSGTYSDVKFELSIWTSDGNDVYTGIMEDITLAQDAGREANVIRGTLTLQRTSA